MVFQARTDNIEDLGESDVPLTENVVRKPPREFSATLSEWAGSDHAGFKPFIKTLSAVGTFLQVDPKETIFITSAFITAAEAANATTHGFAFIRILDSEYGIAFVLSVIVDHITGQHGGSESSAISFPMPLRLNAPTRVVVDLNGFTTPLVVAGITGFSIAKKISI